jgi:hypothetical protein
VARDDQAERGSELFHAVTVQLDSKNPQRGGTINHNVFSDVMQAYTGTVQARPFLFDGPDYLNLEHRIHFDIGPPGEELP